MKSGSTKAMTEKHEMQDEYDFKHGIRGRFYRPEKRSITIRLDDDLLLYFKKKAGERKVGYQTLVNEALREYVNRHGTPGTAENP